MPDEGYMDAAGIDTPDGGDDTLREQLARTLADQEATDRGALPYSDISWACVRHEWLPRADALLPLIREHTAANALTITARAEKAEAAIGRAMQVYRQHTTSGASAWCKCIACDMARTLAYDGTGAEHG